ncbi:MAG: hypothetical protein IJ736_07820, partial [Firmicutes bacterium]|nr:hypothetical protein [Bacillota bacterium]
KYVLKIANQSECMINALLYEKKEEIKNILLLDFSDEGLRSKAYRINRNDGINAECIYREANKQVSTKKIEDDVYKLFCELYKQDNELDNRAKDLLEGFTFEHKDLIFQKMRTGCRIYFNFAYPPIRKNLTSEMIKAVIAPMEEKINEITDNIFSRINGFNAVILSGGGFENSWSKDIIEKKYSKTIYEGKGTKRIISDGACIIAAIMLGATESENISVREKVIQKEEIGIMTKSREGDIFTALIESDRISASEGEEKKFILKGEESANIDFFSRNEKGDMKRIWSVTLNELPKRKKGALRIAVRLNINEKGELTAVFKDDGFGEIYPKTDYIRRFTLLMKNTIGDEMN